MIKYNTPQELFTAICNSIRNKTNSNELINHQDIPDKIDKLLTSNDIKLFIDSAIQRKNTICYSFNNTTITKISSKIFATTNLTNIDLLECTSIGNGAFEGCTNLTTVNLPKCTSIGSCAFCGCTNLTTIDLPECTVIDSSPHHTVGTINCLNLTTINLPKCISIKDNVFSNCTNLTTVNLPKCTSIGEYAFSGCNNLQIIILGADQIVDISSFTFIYASINNGTGYIYVPDNLVDSYKTATNWSSYANQIKPISELPSNLKEEYGYV